MRLVTTFSRIWFSRMNQPLFRPGASSLVAKDCMCTRPVALSVDGEAEAQAANDWRAGGRCVHL